MAPKRKATIAPSGVKQFKKANQIKKEIVPALTEDDDNERANSGKIVCDKTKDENTFCTFTKNVLSPDLFDKNQNNKEVEIPNLALNKLLNHKSKTSLHGSVRWKTFLFPSLSQLSSSAMTTQQYFGLDLVDEGKERTHWTHKGSVWHDLFETVIEMAKIGQVTPIDIAFKGILSCPVRAEPNGDNIIKTFKSGKGQNIQHWIMLIPMPSNMVYSEYIPEFLTKFQTLYKKPYIQSAYKSGVKGITNHPGMINQISEDGSYWDVLDNATENEVISQSCKSLSDILLDFTIKEVVSIMFHVMKDPNTWNDAVRAFAFGN